MLMKILNTKFHENPSSVSRTNAGGLADGKTDITKMINFCREYANRPNVRGWELLWWTLDEELTRLYPAEDGDTQLQRLFGFLDRV
jgi:hypothetical protein